MKQDLMRNSLGKGECQGWSLGSKACKSKQILATLPGPSSIGRRELGVKEGRDAPEVSLQHVQIEWSLKQPTRGAKEELRWALQAGNVSMGITDIQTCGWCREGHTGAEWKQKRVVVNGKNYLIMTGPDLVTIKSTEIRPNCPLVESKPF